jgi:hypothetical protein
VRRRARLAPVVLALLVLAASVVARFATTNAHADVIAVLQGNVGPDFVISLKNPDGSLVGHLDVGDYEIQVNDQATNHNFHLEGPGGVSMFTDIPTTSTADWFVSLTDGIFTYHCDQHLGLYNNFAVGTAALPPPPAPVSIAPLPVAIPVPPVSSSRKSSSSSSAAVAPSVPSVGGTLKASLVGMKIKLTVNGKPLTKVAAGTYQLVVADSSKSLDLSLAQTRGGVSEQPLTTTAFTGTKTVTVDLLAGQWKVYSAAGQGVFSFFTVTR